MKKLSFFWKELLATFWFVPVLFILFAVFLAMSLIALDDYVTIPQDSWARFLLVNNFDSARSILSTISGAMIGVAGTVFSVTLVVLTLASSQFGPRLIKNFMYVRINQIVLGSYISTFLYCLLILNAIKDNGEYFFIPSISIFVAILITILNIVLLIVFIHKVAISIQADKVISDISSSISKQVKSIFPEDMGDETENEDKIDIAIETSEFPNVISLNSPRDGYLQYLDTDSLLEIVVDQNLMLELYHRPGSFLVEGTELGILYSKVDLDEDSLNDLLDQFVIGKTKTAQQDLEFSIHQMVEIAARALSPGINDPFTAISCIDNLTASMCYLARAKFPSKYRFDKDGKLRIMADVLEFEGVLDAAFNQIRQFSVGNAAVIIKLMESLITILSFTKNEVDKKAVIKHAEMVLTVGKTTIKEKNDIEDLIERAEKILK
jgi:uncharacterized membrane protein